jgi:hypothetical protein
LLPIGFIQQPGIAEYLGHSGTLIDGLRLGPNHDLGFFSDGF